MLLDFSIENYRSIKDKISLNLSYEQRAPKNYEESDVLHFIELKNKIKTTPVLSILGSNASGKSNMIKALRTFKNIVSRDLNYKEAPFPYDPFLLSDYDDKKTSFEIKFYKNDAVYKYALAYNNAKIIEEKLYKINKPSKEDVIFEVANNQQEKYFRTTLKSKDYNFESIYDNECSFISLFLCKIAIKYPGLSKDINNVFDFIKNDLSVFEDNNFSKSYSIDCASTDSTDISEGIEKIAKHLIKMDIGIEKILVNRDIQEINPEQKIEINPSNEVSVKKGKDGKVLMRTDNFSSFHKKDDGSLKEFEFARESLGTRTLFSLLGVVIETLDKGTVLVIDEIDRSLHTKLLEYIIKMFKRKSINKNNAQIIFATHNPYVLDNNILNKWEVAFTSKVLNSTQIKYLSEYNIKNEVNFRKQYLEGRFDGIPNTIFDSEDF